MSHNNRRRMNSFAEEEPLMVELTRNYWTFRYNSKSRSHPHPPPPPHHHPSFLSSYKYLGITLAVILMGIRISWNYPHRLVSQNTDNEMIWDYNAYHLNVSSSLLMAQQEDIETDQTSLPIRAYARQLGINYVRFRNGQQLQELLQLPYQVIAFFPANAVLIHLDRSLQELLPTKDQVMAVGKTTGFFALNLRYSDTLRALVQRQHSLSSLRSFLSSQVTQVSYLPEQADGFVGTNRLLQCIPRQMPEYEMIVSTTVASVCYRYYPKCDVL
ncbi:hypothetical protein FisN_31Lh077 [Fistulifera solaris]|uniref:Uncharacterized protein n=1 Tax=Fistulifera solaris TaxID=1519565 RepID=A0A1Z5K6B4_FISSO|nr:hypothetical protein FisN_31Lh077 [Fistulifera solaris]|eukprot:GAX21787.1 hypothetical protein FisN_31Lh077 [Fistulifera solaris]